MSDINQREHFRVEMTVPVKWKILTDSEKEIVNKGMGNTLFREGGIPSPIDTFLEEASPGSKDEQLYQSLQLLNNKLDFIIEQMMSSSQNRISGNDNIMEISASGLKFSSEEKFEKGTMLKMELIMPGIVQYNMELITEIVRVTESDNRYINAASIVHIREDARDSIVKLVFQKQRIDIRNNRNSEDIN